MPSFVLSHYEGIKLNCKKKHTDGNSVKEFVILSACLFVLNYLKTGGMLKATPVISRTYIYRQSPVKTPAIKHQRSNLYVLTKVPHCIRAI